MINRAPYEASLGQRKWETTDTSLPGEVLSSIVTEKDLEQALQEQTLHEFLPR